jgi:hypothetical protein
VTERDADGVQHTETRDAGEMCITDRGARTDGARRDVPRRHRTKRTARLRYPLSSHTRVHGTRSLFGSGQEYAAVFIRSGRRVKTRTDGLGRYRVGLAPGWWKVSTATVPRIGSGIEPHAVRVFSARFRVVNLEIDTGIR